MGICLMGEGVLGMFGDGGSGWGVCWGKVVVNVE